MLPRGRNRRRISQCLIGALLVTIFVETLLLSGLSNIKQHPWFEYLDSGKRAGAGEEILPHAEERTLKSASNSAQSNGATNDKKITTNQQEELGHDSNKKSAIETIKPIKGETQNSKEADTLGRQNTQNQAVQLGLTKDNGKGNVKPKPLPVNERNAGNRATKKSIMQQLLAQKKNGVRGLNQGRDMPHTAKPTAAAQHGIMTGPPEETIPSDDEEDTSVQQIVYQKAVLSTDNPPKMDITLIVIVWEKSEGDLEKTMKSTTSTGLLQAVNVIIFLAMETPTPTLKRMASLYNATLVNTKKGTCLAAKITDAIKKHVETKYVLLMPPGWKIPTFMKGWPLVLGGSIDLLESAEAKVVRLYDPEVNKPRSPHSFATRCSTLSASNPPYWLCNCFFRLEGFATTFEDEMWRCGPEQGQAAFYCTKGNRCNFSLNPSLFKRGFWLQYLTWFSKNDKSITQKTFEHSYRKTWKKLDITIATSHAIFQKAQK